MGLFFTIQLGKRSYTLLTFIFVKLKATWNGKVKSDTRIIGRCYLLRFFFSPRLVASRDDDESYHVLLTPMATVFSMIYKPETKDAVDFVVE